MSVKLNDTDTAYTSEMMRKMRLAAISLMPTESHYVVTVPHGDSERVAYGMSLPMSKRAAGQLVRSLKPLYKGKDGKGKPRAIMVKTAVKDGLFS